MCNAGTNDFGSSVGAVYDRVFRQFQRKRAVIDRAYRTLLVQADRVHDRTVLVLRYHTEEPDRNRESVAFGF
jgi:hypothetical protein